MLDQELDIGVARILSLDLSMIKKKLMDPEEGKGWSQEQVDAVEVWYRRFLILNLKHPDRKVVPTDEIDDFWHAHILDTRKYEKDCQEVFGYFFHHYPYFGMEGDRLELERSFEGSMRSFEEEFGETPPSLVSSGCNGGGSRCRNCRGSH